MKFIGCIANCCTFVIQVCSRMDNEDGTVTLGCVAQGDCAVHEEEGGDEVKGIHYIYSYPETEPFG